jgi:hypothetical protein
VVVHAREEPKVSSPPEVSGRFEIRTSETPVAVSEAGSDSDTDGVMVYAAPPLIVTEPVGGSESPPSGPSS